MIKTKQLCLAALGALTLSASAAAQTFDSQNVELRAWINLTTFGSASGNDCWGYVSSSGREYALMGLDNKVAFVEVTDPDNPVWFASFPHTPSLWGDIKVYEHAAYAVTEASGTGIQVFDMSDIDNHVVTLVRTMVVPGRSHNIAVDTTSGFLYTCGSNEGSATTMIFDLSNPTNPVLAGTWNGAYEHDIFAHTYTSGPYAGRQIVFGSSEGRGLDVIDVTNKAAPALLSRTPYPSVAYAHQAWSEDLQYLFLDDELDSLQRTGVFDISNLSSPQYLGSFSTGLAATDHNLYVRDGFVFASNYRAGLRIWDTNVDPVNPPQVGWFDTYPGSDGSGFEGSWSNYPFFPSGIVIISDINRGLFIVDPSPALEGSLGFEYPDGRPERVLPTGGTTMRVRVVTASGGAEHQPGTGVLLVDRGSGFEPFPMNLIASDEYEAVFPDSPCGSVIDWYVTAESTTGRVFSDPINAPTTTFSALSAADVIIAFEDDFETNLGWTVENISLSSGAWERGIPAGDGSRGDPTDDFDNSGRCFITGNAAGDSDVDGGPTRLISPVFDLSSQPDALVSYARWFTNDDGDGDRLEIHISNNNGSTWTLVESVPSGTGWTQSQFLPSDFVSLTNQMKLRFSAMDNPNDSVTEAGLDAFAIQTLVCGGTELTDFAVVFGTLISGGFEQLLDSDNARVRARSRFGFASVGSHVLDLRFDFVTTQLAGSTLDLVVEGRANAPGVTGRVRLRNVDTGVLEQVHQYSVPTTEQVESIADIPAGNYIDQADGAIVVRVQMSAVATFSVGGFDGFYDQVAMSVE